MSATNQNTKIIRIVKITYIRKDKLLVNNNSYSFKNALRHQH